MERADITMEQMNPFVRYVHAYSVGYDTPFVNVVPYDCRCIYILEGDGFLNLDGCVYPAESGSLFLWPAGLAYGYVPYIDRPFSALGINFDYTLACSSVVVPVPPVPAVEYRRNDILSPVRVRDCEPFNRTVALQGMFWAKDVLQHMEREYRTRRYYFSQRLRGQMLCLLCDIARILNATDKHADGVCEALMEYVHAHYREQLTNEALSREFSFDPAYLSRLIKRQTGIPLHQYLLHYRLSVALNLLQTTRLPIGEVAAQSGFTDSNYFSRCFKYHWGSSPRAFRPRD